MKEIDLKREATLIDCSELKRIIVENPDLPLIIFAGEEAYDDERFPYTACGEVTPHIEKITLYKDEEWVNREVLEEKMEIDLCDEEEYKGLSDEEFYKKVNEIVEETPFIEAIVIYVG